MNNCKKFQQWTDLDKLLLHVDFFCFNYVKINWLNDYKILEFNISYIQQHSNK